MNWLKLLGRKNVRRPANPQLDGDQLSEAGQGVLRFLENPFGHQLDDFHDKDSYLRAASSKLWMTFRCIHLICGQVAQTKVKVESATRGEIDNHPVTDLFTRRPSAYQSPYEFFFLIAAYLKLTGDCYIFKDEVSDTNVPHALYPLNPKWIITYPDVENRVKYYGYRVNGIEIQYTPDQIIHIRQPNWNNEQYGLGDLEGGECLANSAIDRQILERHLARRGGVPPGILTMEPEEANQISAEEFKAMKQEWLREHFQQSSIGKPAWLIGKWQYLNLGVGLDDLLSVERSKMTAENLATLHGVPLSMLGLGANNFATSRSDEMGFRQYTVQPLVSLIMSAFNSELMSLYRGKAQLCGLVDGVIDTERVAKESAPLFDRAILNGNDVRVRLGLPKSDDPMMDQYFIKAGYVPLDMVKEMTERGMLAAENNNSGEGEESEAPKPTDETPAGTTNDKA